MLHPFSHDRWLVSVTKFIRIGIADKNDNPPYFDKALYEAEVDENEDIQHTVLTVTAKDHDECEYFLILMNPVPKRPHTSDFYCPSRGYCSIKVPEQLVARLQSTGYLCWVLEGSSDF